MIIPVEDHRTTTDDLTLASALAVTQPGDTLQFEGRRTYKFLRGYKWPVGASLNGAGCTFDLTALNTTLLEIGDGTSIVTSGPQMKVEGVTLVGNIINPSCLFLKAHSIERRLIIRDIVSSQINNLLDFRGPCFSTVIEGVKSTYSNGVWMNFDLDLNGYPIGANQTSINHCELSNNSSAPGGTGINVAAYMQNLDINHTWIEAVNRGIVNNGRYTSIRSCIIYTGGPSPIGVLMTNNGNIAAGWDSFVTGCKFATMTTDGSAIGLEVSQNIYNTIVDNNVFYSNKGQAIVNGSSSISGTNILK